MTTPYLEVVNLTKVYGSGEGIVKALENVSLDVCENEFVSVVGPSGCGKSTLMKVIAGLVGKTGGEVLVKGVPVSGPQRNIGVVFQDPALFEWRRVIGNVMFPAEVMGLDGAKANKQAMDLIRLVGLEHFEDKYPYELSGGMQQRVAICRALIHEPALLLMDEPFGALDAFTREQLNVELLRIWREKKSTVLFITHDIAEAVFLSDRIVVMTPRPGRVRDVVEIALPRPRDLSIKGTEKFGLYANFIRERFGLIRSST